MALQETKVDNIKLKLLLEERERQVEDLKTQLLTAQEENKKLLRESGEQFARGMMEALERRGDFGKSNRSD